MSNLPFTLDQLKILYTIFEEGSFKKAAKKLYISQPAVSLQIQNLEKQLNVPLFYRNRRKAYLTKNGELLKNYCEKILNLCEEACQALDELQTYQTGSIVMGASQTIGTYLMPRLIGIFRHKYPHINIDLKVQSTRQISWAVANGQIDLALIGGEIPQEFQDTLDITPYAEDELALILSTSHPFASLEYIRKEDLYRLRYITMNKQSSSIHSLVEKVLNQNGIDSTCFKFEMELNSVEAIKNAVQSGLGAAFVSVSAISKELDLKILHWAKIEGITIKRTLYIITNPQFYNFAITNLVKKELLDMFVLPKNKESK